MQASVFLVLTGVVLCVCQDEDYAWPSPEEEECIKSLNLDRKYLEKIINSYAPGQLPENDEQFLKLSLCRSEQNETHNKDGTLNFENLVQYIEEFNKAIYGGKEGEIGEEIALKAVESCKSVASENDLAKKVLRMENCIDSYLTKYFHENKN